MNTKKRDFSKSRPPAGQHKQKRLSVYFQKKAARRATQTKTTKRLFSNSLFTKRPLTTQNVESEMAMDLCIDEKDEE